MSNEKFKNSIPIPPLPEEKSQGLLTPTVIFEEKPIQRATFRRAGHLQDQMLKYDYPGDRAEQPSLFDLLEQSTRDKILSHKTEYSTVVEGIKLTPSEQKVIDCLTKLLHEKSQTKDSGKEDYYAGNLGSELVSYSVKTAKQFTNKHDIKGKEIARRSDSHAPKLAFTLYELTKEYKGGHAIGGKDVENVKSIIRELENKKFLLSYIEKYYKEDGGRVERKIEDFQSLLRILQISETEYSKSDIEISKKEETVILLNPIFKQQIDSKYILYPTDINRRTIIAYGSHNLSETVLRLRDYLIREINHKRLEPEIGLDRFYYLLNEKWMREGRKKKVKEFADKAIATVKALGLLESHEFSVGKTGITKVKFKLNKGWE